MGTKLSVAALLAALLAAPVLLVGCRGGGDDAEQGESITAMTGEMAETDVADRVAGNWQVVLNPSAVDAGASPVIVPLELQVGAMTGSATKEAQLTGTLAGNTISDGRLTTSAAGTKLEFVAGGFTVESVTDITVPEGVTWSAALDSNGNLAGVAVTEDGQAPKWDAQKQ